MPESVKSSIPDSKTDMFNLFYGKYARHPKPVIPPPVAPAMADMLAVKAAQEKQMLALGAPPKQTIDKLLANAYDDRPPSDHDKSPQYVGHFAGKKPEHPHYNPKTIAQANQASAPNMYQVKGPQKFQMLAGTTNPNEKWWYNEAVNKSQQGVKADDKVAEKVNQEGRKPYRYVRESEKWGQVTGKIR